jgi:hypothetical protein
MEGVMSFGGYRFGTRFFEAFAEAMTVEFDRITLSRVSELAEALHVRTGGHKLAPLDVHEMAEALRKHGLDSTPFDVVMHVAGLVSKVAPQEDVLAKITLRDLHDLTNRQQGG